MTLTVGVVAAVAVEAPNVAPLVVDHALRTAASCCPAQSCCQAAETVQRYCWADNPVKPVAVHALKKKKKTLLGYQQQKTLTDLMTDWSCLLPDLVQLQHRCCWDHHAVCAELHQPSVPPPRANLRYCHAVHAVHLKNQHPLLELWQVMEQLCEPVSAKKKPGEQQQLV